MRHRSAGLEEFDGMLMTRVNLETMKPMDAKTVPRRVIELIRDLMKEGRL